MFAQASKRAVWYKDAGTTEAKVYQGLKSWGHSLPKPPYLKDATLEVIEHSGGTTAVAYNIYAHANSISHLRIGIAVAGNSGRPGGACGIWDGRDECTTDKETLHAYHETQEEDIVSNWLLTEQDPDTVYADTICGVWGMVDPKGTSKKTVQQRDYSNATPEKYNDAWVVRNAKMSYKDVSINEKREVEKKFDYKNTFRASLVFVAGPNVAENSLRRAADSTMRRTYNYSAVKKYEDFRQGVAFAQYACLYAMAASNCNVAMLAYVSGGIYAGPWKKQINEDYTTLLNELLIKGGPLKGQTPLGRFFERVVLVKLPFTAARTVAQGASQLKSSGARRAAPTRKPVKR
jgi:hypothetical protein